VKNSNEWVRQPMVDKAADEITAGQKCTPAEVTPYQVAKRLDCEPNGALYAKVRDWRRRRQDEMGLVAIDLPAGAETEFRAMLENLTTEATDHFVRTVRMVGSDLDRTAALRIADAERRRVEAESETAEVLELCQHAELDLGAANTRIGELEEALAQAQRREDMLRGRLEQRDADAAKPGTTTETDEVAAADGTTAPSRPDTMDADAPVQQSMPFHEAEGAPE
jgi:hypothetical protein